MNYKLLKTVDEIENYISHYKLLAIDIETSPLDKYRSDEKAALDSNKSKIVGISISVEKCTGIYIPLCHRGYENADFNKVWPWIKNNILFDENKIVVIHNAAFEGAFFYALGIVPKCKIYDTMVAAQLTLKTKTQFRKLSDSSLKTLVPELLKIDLPTFESVTNGKFFDELNSENSETIKYACADSDFALRLYYVFNKWFDENLPKHRFLVGKNRIPNCCICRNNETQWAFDGCKFNAPKARRIRRNASGT